MDFFDIFSTEKESKLSKMVRKIRRSYFISSYESDDPESSVRFYESDYTTRETASIPIIIELLNNLDLHEDENLLIIGSKGGYLEYLSAIFCNEVYVIDVNSEVVDITKKNIQKGSHIMLNKGLKVEGIHVRTCQNPLNGLPENGPWDKILIPAAVKSIPKALFDQLTENGKIIVPIIKGYKSQYLTEFKKLGGKIYKKEFLQVIFAPLDVNRKPHQMEKELTLKTKPTSSLDEPLLVFLSYATVDSNRFQIPKIAEMLTTFPEIEDCLYWEEDLHDDIFDYMNDNLEKCDIFILFCSKNALKSEPVKMEWKAALKIKKRIIPVYFQENDIPPLLSTKLGTHFHPEDLESTVNDLFKLILKKTSN